MRLLLVEDNRALADWLGRTLRKQHYTVDWLDNGADADFVLRSETYDLVILDLTLPKMDGQEVLRRLRARGNRTPVLVLTADNTTHSRVSELRQVVSGDSIDAARAEEEMGDLLFSMANLSRQLGIEPEAALRRANMKFTTRFEAMERRIVESGRRVEHLTLDELEAEWQRVKSG